MKHDEANEYNYTHKRQPDCIPHVCNDFLTEYLPLTCNVFDPKVAIGMTQHFTTWLYNRKFTKHRLELINN